MKQLIEALQILLKYGNPELPTSCEDGILWINGINPDDVSVDDESRLHKLGFMVDEDDSGIGTPRYKSYHFGG